MNEIDQKILERPALGLWDSSGRDRASDFGGDLDAFVDRIGRYEERTDD